MQAGQAHPDRNRQGVSEPDRTATALPVEATCDTSPDALARRIAVARRAQRAWRLRSPRQRARLVAALRHRLASEADTLVAAVGDRFDRGAAETLTTEIIPLADALRFIERCTARLLAPRRFGARGRPAWLIGVHGKVRRTAFGVVGIIAPGNYRLLLAGVQICQALAAGNAVLIKPAPGAAAPLRWLVAALIELGVPADLVTLLPDDQAAGAALADAAIDKLVLTGSAATGRAVAGRLARRAVPAALELSGNDAVFVLDAAAVPLAARAIVWAMGLNGGATCIAPRRIFVRRAHYEALADALAGEIEQAAPRAVAPAAYDSACACIAAAVNAGWYVIGRPPDATTPRMSPCILASATACEPALPGDLFAPVASLLAVDDIEDALRHDQAAEHALGAAIFGDHAAATTLAENLDAGVITINDLIAPTADPRAPFVGARASGYGETRGAEGLLAMTRPQTVLTRRGRLRPHLNTPRAADTALFKAYLGVAHGRGVKPRLASLLAAIRAGRARMREDDRP